MSFYKYRPWYCRLQRFLGRRHREAKAAARLLAQYGVDVVLDVGANEGQFVRRLFSQGYDGRVVSFEPGMAAFTQLEAHARSWHNWQAIHLALGAVDGDASLLIAGNSQSSSLLPMEPLHAEAAPESRYVRQETTPIRRLDSVIDDYCRPDDRCFLKLDVQGSERDVLRGAQQALQRCVGVQLEMSLAPLYRGETLFRDMWDVMSALQFDLLSFSPAFMDQRTGQTLQIDGIFFRHSEIASRRTQAAA